MRPLNQRWSRQTIPDHDRLLEVLGREIENIYKNLLTRAEADQVTVTTVQNIINSASGGSGSVALGFNLRRVVQAVVAGTNTITFSSPMATASYALTSPRIYDVNGNPLSHGRITKSISGFIIEDVLDAGSLECVAVELS